MLNQTSETSIVVSGPVKGRRTAVFVLWVYTEPTMEVLNKMLWLVQLLSTPVRYCCIQKFKNSKRVQIQHESIYSNLLLSHTPTVTSPTSITKPCKHIFSSLHSQAKQPPTHQPSPSLILHISPIKNGTSSNPLMARPSRAAWAVLQPPQWE